MTIQIKRRLRALPERDAMSACLQAVRESERKRIAMEMHDELGQLLTALRIEVLLLKQNIDNDLIALQKADEMKRLVDSIIGAVRGVVNHIRPAALDFGIVPALEWLADDFRRRTSIPCCLIAVGPEPSLSESHTVGIFRIVQESLTNISRHASASQVEIRLTKSGSRVELIVADDGRGFDMPVRRLGSYGLVGMADRAKMMDAHLKIHSRPGNGSVIKLRVREDGRT